MNRIRRISIFSFIIILVLFIGLVFSTWMIPNIIQPVSQTIWLFFRLFILNVDQVYYWNFLAIIIIIIIIYRLARRAPAKRQVDAIARSEFTGRLRGWHDTLDFSKFDARGQEIAREKLFHLLVSHYSARNPFAEYSTIRHDLEKQRLPMPDSVYRFLFPSNTNPSKEGLTYIRTFSVWLRRSFNRQKPAFDNMIDDLIEFLKT